VDITKLHLLTNEIVIMQTRLLGVFTGMTVDVFTHRFFRVPGEDLMRVIAGFHVAPNRKLKRGKMPLN
jgi:hypothetical protein